MVKTKYFQLGGSSKNASGQGAIDMVPEPVKATRIACQILQYRNASHLVMPRGHALFSDVLRYAKRHSKERLFVGCHADKADDAADNLLLSDRRARGCLHLLENKPDEWAALAIEDHYSGQPGYTKSHREDIVEVMEFLRGALGWGEDIVTPKATESLTKVLEAFNTAHNQSVAAGKSIGAMVENLSAPSVEPWKVVHAEYVKQIEGEELKGVKLTFADEKKKAVGFGEKHPIDKKNDRLEHNVKDRRAEFIFFTLRPGEELDKGPEEFYTNRKAFSVSEWTCPPTGRSVIIFDISGSMASQKATLTFPGGTTEPTFSELGVRAVNDFIGRMSFNTDFTVLAFSTQVSAWSETMIPALGAKRTEARAWVSGLKFHAFTYTEGALLKALEIKDEHGEGVEKIYFFSDGLPSHYPIEGRVEGNSKTTHETAELVLKSYDPRTVFTYFPDLRETDPEYVKIPAPVASYQAAMVGKRTEEQSKKDAVTKLKELGIYVRFENRSRVYTSNAEDVFDFIVSNPNRANWKVNASKYAPEEMRAPSEFNFTTNVAKASVLVDKIMGDVDEYRVAVETRIRFQKEVSGALVAWMQRRVLETMVARRNAITPDTKRWVIDTFVFGDDPDINKFMKELAEKCGGQAKVVTTPDYVLGMGR